MGTRAQCFIKDSSNVGQGVYLYQHWDGDGLLDTVVNAVQSPAGRVRQDDPEYLARIIFCAMVKEDVEGETGYGIGTHPRSDIQYLVTVDCKNKTITEERIFNTHDETLRVVNFLEDNIVRD